MEKYRLDVVYFEEEDVICTSDDEEVLAGDIPEP